MALRPLEQYKWPVAALPVPESCSGQSKQKQGSIWKDGSGQCTPAPGRPVIPLAPWYLTLYVLSCEALRCPDESVRRLQGRGQVGGLLLLP